MVQVSGMGVWMLDNLFPECVWAGFGEHVGENEFNEHADLVSFALSWSSPGHVLGSPNVKGG